MIGLNTEIFGTVRENKFPPGTVVRHKRYGYRGVVVNADSHCKANEEWYQSNQTQPDRSQPWYHVLVDGGGITYPAETSLEEDPAPEEIDHQLVPMFFLDFANGQYVRNETPWPYEMA